ncbi:MAG: diacylglycerol kinase family protein [Heliobacteriaceae bacterium]|jgi:diacylglycerol kinase|nr:diacylglycerol kinase family protein [Heliobacteriaceae bacterium]
MSKFKCQGFGSTFKNARKGMRLALKAEDCIKVHFFAALLAIVLGIALNFSAIKLCVLLLTIGLVIITEMLNSAIEFSLDAVFKNKYSQMVGMAKDISAGAVLVATLIAVSIGIIMFVPALICLFR